MLASCKTLANFTPARTRKGAQRWLALAATGDVGHQQGGCVTGSDKLTNSRSAPTIMAAPRRWLLLAAGASASIHDLVVDKDRRALYRIESFCFVEGGVLELDVSDFRVDGRGCLLYTSPSPRDRG